MGVLSNVFGTGQFNPGPSAVQAQTLSNEGFQLTKPFIQNVLEAGQAQFFQDSVDPATGQTVQQLVPFEQFTGPRIADFSPEQQEAFTGLSQIGREGLASAGLASSVPFFQQAQQQAGLGSLTFDDAARERLSNPFLRGVTDTAKREAVRQFESVVEPKLRAEAAAAGSFGGSRAAILEAEAQRNLQRQLSDIEERGAAAAFEQAQRAFDTEKGRQLQASALFSGLGEAVPAQAARELALLSSVGEAQQAQEQRALDLAEKEFIEQREFPTRQLQEFQSLVRGFPFTPSTFQVTTSQQPQPSIGQQLLGTLGTGAGIFGALGGFKNKAGGQVVPRQSGGQIRGGLASLERHQNNVNPKMGRRVTREELRQPAPFAGAIPIMSDIISGLFGSRRQIPANMQPRFSGQRASDLPPVVRVGEAASNFPGSLSETSALVEVIQPKEKSLSDKILNFGGILDGPSIKELAEGLGRSSLRTGEAIAAPFLSTSDDTYGGDLSAYNDLLGEQFRRRQTAEDLERIKKAQPIRGGRGERTREERRRGENIPDFDAFTPPELSDEEKKVAAETQKAAEIEKAANAVQAETSAAASNNIIDPNANVNLARGKPELTNTYGDLDKAFADYLSFLDKEKESKDDLKTEADESRESQLWAELAATSARFAGQAGPGGFLSKLNKAALPSIERLKEIQKDYRKEMKAAKAIEKDVLKNKLNINLAKTKLDMERSKLDSENDLRSAKAYAERVTRSNLEAKDAYNALDKSLEKGLQTPLVRATAFNLLAGQIERGVGVDKALATVTNFVRSQTGVRPSGTTGTRTTQAALNDAQQAAKAKLDAARSS